MTALELPRRSRLAVPCVLLFLWSPACRRGSDEKGGARAPPIAPAAAAGAGSSIRLATVDPADDPGPRATPLRVVFAADGGAVAYVAARADALRVVHGGRADRPVSAVDQIALSPDGKRIAYSAEVDGRWGMVVDGAVRAGSTSVGAPVFSPDGRHLAYRATSAGGNRLVVDGVEGPVRHELVGDPVFSADSTRVALVERVAEGAPARLVVSDLSLATRDLGPSGVEQMVASAAGTELAVVVREGDKRRVLRLGLAPPRAAAAGAPFDAISSPVFARDGASLAYVAERGGRTVLVLDGKEAALPEGTVSGPPAIRGDGRGAGVILDTAGGPLPYGAFEAQAAAAPARYDEATDLAYARSGAASAFCARRGASWFVVASGREGPPFDRVVSPQFTADGAHLVYRARKDGSRFVVIADAEGRTIRQLPAYEQVFPVVLAKDGKSIGYGVKDGRELAWKVEPLPSP